MFKERNAWFAEFGGKHGTRFLLQAEDGIRDIGVTGVQTCALPIFLADQRMPRMSGVEFLGEALGLYPDARRALLTAYSDTEAAIKAINDIDLDYYLRKPWEPPDENLYPVVDDLLDAWLAEAPPEVEDVRLVGPRFLAEGHVLRDLLARNGIAYRWYDIDEDPEARRLP